MTKYISPEQFLHDFGAPLLTAVVVALLTSLLTLRRDVRQRNLEKKHDAYLRLLDTLHNLYLQMLAASTEGFVREESNEIQKSQARLDDINIGQVEVLSKMYSNSDVQVNIEQWGKARIHFWRECDELHEPTKQRTTKEILEQTQLSRVLKALEAVGEAQSSILVAVRKDLKLHPNLLSRFKHWSGKKMKKVWGTLRRKS
jgi:hypothetical protein